MGRSHFIEVDAYTSMKCERHPPVGGRRLLVHVP